MQFLSLPDIILECSLFYARKSIVQINDANVLPSDCRSDGSINISMKQKISCHNII